MSQNEKETNKTLTIGSKLKLSKTFDKSKLQLGVSAKSKVTVIKKRRFSISSPNLVREQEIKQDSSSTSGQTGADSAQGSLTDKERQARLAALQNVTKSNQIFESQDLTPDLPIVETSTPEKDLTTKTPHDQTEKTDKVKPKVTKAVKTFDEDVEKGPKKKVKNEVKQQKTRYNQPRRTSGKINVNAIREDDSGFEKTRSLASIKRAREKARRALDNDLRKDGEKIVREVIVPELISVQELANRMSERVTDVTKELMKLGMIVTANQEIDADTAEIIIETFKHKIIRVSDSDIEKILESSPVDDVMLTKRAPVVTIMGHVDHGKTSLLDALRQSDVVSSEAGGITQHIGACKISIENGEFITFIDTPGHEAFTEMRARGAKVTDIVILVVAADDGIMEQTKEAINHAKAAEVPIIVAINKIDKPAANPSRVKNELLNFGLIPEDLGGDIMVVEVSAKQKLGLDKIKETIMLQAELLDLKAYAQGKAQGVVLESKKDKNKGVLTTLLIQKGSLSIGDIIVAGTGFGRIRKIIDEKMRVQKQALPSMPVEVLGLNTSPDAGEIFNVVDTEKQARDIVEYRARQISRKKASSIKRSKLEDLFTASANGKSVIKELPLIIKADVHGSLEAIKGSLTKFDNDEVRVNIIHAGVGAITKSDIIFANTSGAIILGFNVRADQQAKSEFSDYDVDIRYYSIIYNLVDDIKQVLSGMLSPIVREVYLGTVKVINVFNISKVGKIAGCIVNEGTIEHSSNVRLLRDNVVIHEGKIKTLKRYKDDVKEVKSGQECGIEIEKYSDIKINDMIEVFKKVEEQKKL